jgi:hypothetical protein
VTCLSLRLETAGCHDSKAAATGWLLPSGRWLVPISTVGMLVTGSDASVASGMSITVEPANGHHSVAACTAPSAQVLAA